MIKNLNLKWRITDNILEYSYNDEDTWINLLEDEDNNTIISILVQILESPNITIDEANFIFQYIDNQGLLMEVLLEIDQMFHGYAFPIKTIDALLRTVISKTVLSIPKLYTILAKSTYVITKIINSRVISDKRITNFVNYIIDKHFMFLITEFRLLNNQLLLKHASLTNINKMANLTYNNVDVFINFLLLLEISNQHIIELLSQDRWMNLDPNSILFKRLMSEVRTFKKIYNDKHNLS